MHNVNTDVLNQTIATAQQDPNALKQRVSFDGEWQTEQGQPQFRATIAVPNGVTDNPPVQRIDWHLEVDADAPREKLEALKRIADEHCPGVYCLRNPIELSTHLTA